MSRETTQWLNTQTLIGFTDKRGHAWHYRAEAQGDESNHYPGAVPVADVQRRLFHWDAMARPLLVTVPADIESADTVDGDGLPVRYVPVDGRKAITRSDTGAVLGLFADSYAIHQYREWLLETVATILDDSLSIGSAGLLKGGAVAWVSVEIPDTITTPEGIAFRPNLLACTSHDGTLATTFQRVVTNVVCDNTMSAALSEKGQRIKVKHSRHSKMRMGEARDALAIIHTMGEEFTQQVAELTRQEVSRKQWAKFVDAYAPLPEDTSKPSRTLTMATNKRDELNRLWNTDTRVAPWAGTAWGVVQAVNTYVHHSSIVRNTSRAERNMLRAVEGGADALDRETVEILGKVLATV